MLMNLNAIKVCKLMDIYTIIYDILCWIKENLKYIYMNGLVMMVISTKNWEFWPNSISTM